MNEIKILKLTNNPELKKEAANWFHEKWKVPLKAYEESMEMCIQSKGTDSQWYLIKNHSQIIGGAGIIENDFHNRKDLTPNICAVYVEKECRGQGIAGKLLNFICEDMRKQGVNVVYLVTDLNSFYEKYGWKYLCMVKEEGQSTMSRMYIHEYSE